MSVVTEPQLTPSAPAKPQNTWRIVTTVVAIVALLTIGVLAVAVVSQHDKAQAARDHASELSDDLAGAKAELRVTEGKLGDTEDELSNTEQRLLGVTDDLTEANDTIEKCSIWPKIANHLSDANSYLIDGVGADVWTSISALEGATRELNAATRLLDKNQSYDGELLDICLPGGSNA